MNDEALLPAERKILAELGHLPLDFRAMWAISNVFRSSTAPRRRLEATVLAPDRLSWTAFTALWVLWIWGEMESRDFASAVGIRRASFSSRSLRAAAERSKSSSPGSTRRKRTSDQCCRARTRDHLAAMLRELLTGVDTRSGAATP